MQTRHKAAFLFLAVMTVSALAGNPALAHRFNVALVLPLSDAAAAQGRDIRDGFMLATAEKDSHPAQESDGHLGGLDVYVTTMDEQGDVAAEIERMAAQGKVDIVASFGSAGTLSLIERLLDGKKVALLRPGQSPFSSSVLPTAAAAQLPAVAAFMAAYEKQYGRRPSSGAAQGYTAARRIDVAVRAQGGVDDTASLNRTFSETERGFTW